MPVFELIQLTPPKVQGSQPIETPLGEFDLPGLPVPGAAIRNGVDVYQVINHTWNLQERSVTVFVQLKARLVPVTPHKVIAEA